MSDQNTETYQIIFNSQGSNLLSPNNTSPARASISYDINWESIIPRGKYNKFRCQFIFKTTLYAGLLGDYGFVNMNLGRVNIYDGMQQSQNLGIIYPIYTNTTAGANRSYLTAETSDNNEFVIDYPNNHIITIALNYFNGIIMNNTPHYVLILSLTGFNV
jgi:hypothetical protein